MGTPGEEEGGFSMVMSAWTIEEDLARVRPQWWEWTRSVRVVRVDWRVSGESSGEVDGEEDRILVVAEWNREESSASKASGR